jgi:hypothetical protein
MPLKQAKDVRKEWQARYEFQMKTMSAEPLCIVVVLVADLSGNAANLRCSLLRASPSSCRNIATRYVG